MEYRKINGRLVKANMERWSATIEKAASGNGAVLVIKGDGYPDHGGHWQMDLADAKKYMEKIKAGWDPRKDLN